MTKTSTTNSIEHVEKLVQLMKDKKLSHLKMGDIELTLAQPEPSTLKAVAVPLRDKAKEIEEFNKKFPPLTPKEKQIMDAKELFELASYSSNTSISADEFVKSY